MSEDEETEEETSAAEEQQKLMDIKQTLMGPDAPKTYEEIKAYQSEYAAQQAAVSSATRAEVAAGNIARQTGGAVGATQRVY